MTLGSTTLAGLRAVLTSPVTGPLATAIALALAVALGVVGVAHQAERQSYEARIDVLRRDADRIERGIKAELAACRGVGAVTLDVAAVADAKPSSAGARSLLENQPEGIDACARMESADDAVLRNLRK